MTTSTRTQMPPPTVGRTVHYRMAYGTQSVCPAVITVTEESHVAGSWFDPTSEAEQDRLAKAYAMNHQTAVTALDRDGESFLASQIPPVKPDRIHLCYLAPTGQWHPEFNVPYGHGPGQWSWPPKV